MPQRGGALATSSQAMVHVEDTDDEHEHDHGDPGLALSSGGEYDSDGATPPPPHHHEDLHESTELARRASKDLDAGARGSFNVPTSYAKATGEGVHELSGELDGEEQEEPQGMLPRDRPRRTTFYNERLDKQMSHVDAKQFYQNQQRRENSMDEAGVSGGSPPRAKMYMAGGEGFSRTGSVRSRHSNHSLREPQYRSALPIGLSDPNKPPESVTIQAPGIGRFEGVNGLTHQDDPYIEADKAARAHAHHPGLPHEAKPMLEKEGIHGAGAGVGIEAARDSGVTSELNAIYSKIQKILDIRHKYLRLSLQGQSDNPRDEPSWNIYPPMPEPVWQETKTRPSFTGEEKEPASPKLQKSGTAKKGRKMGQDIGEDFDYEDCLPVPGPSEMTFKLDDLGVYQVYETVKSKELGEPIVPLPSIRDYYMALDAILIISSDGPAKSFAYRRLEYLEGKFNLYVLLNEYQEIADTKSVPHRDFYNVRKVDTHVHHSACMNQKHLLRFIKSKMKKSPDDIVIFRDDKHLTLEEVFESINLTAYDLSIDTLDMHAHTDSFHRFDKFNLKYNPVGESRLREIFLKTDNFIHGRYLAEITKEVIMDLESSKYQMVEWRISVYGRSLDEWDKLAAWVVDNKLYSPNVRWLIQIPRLWDVYKSQKMMQSFEQVLVNIFQPLFEATADPSSHPKLHVFLQRVIGFDSVDDESKVERRMYRKFPLPRQWTTEQNPPYSYWIYYLFVNMASLNVWRKQRGFNTFVLRPHCGEAGDTDHLAAAVLCCHSISHGLLLRKVPLLQYIFFLEQIGVAMSPLSNNALFLAYERNPFLQYFKRGLNVSLSTDDPLQFAFTKEPLMEEYAVAAQIYKLSAVDMCELAKHSVVQSGFEHVVKQRWLGDRYHLPGVAGNDVSKVNVPNIREAFRHETWLQELAMVDRYTNAPASKRVSTVSLRAAAHDGRSTSPSASLKTAPSATNPMGVDSSSHRPEASHYAHAVHAATPHSYQPNAQAARQPAHPGQTDGAGYRPLSGTEAVRPGNVAFNPPGLADAQSMFHTQPPDATSALPFTSSTLNHAEPRYFPGIVASRRRKSSTNHPRSSGTWAMQSGETAEASMHDWMKKDEDGGRGPMVGAVEERSDVIVEETAMEDSD